MEPNKYIEVNFKMEDGEIHNRIFMFDATFRHNSILELVNIYLKDKYASSQQEIVSAGNIRLSSEGYKSYGSSFSLGINSNEAVGPHLNFQLLNGKCEFLPFAYSLVMISGELIDHNKTAGKSGILTVTPEGPKDGLSIVYGCSYHSKEPLDIKAARRKIDNLRRFINCGNL